MQIDTYAVTHIFFKRQSEAVTKLNSQADAFPHSVEI